MTCGLVSFLSLTGGGVPCRGSQLASAGGPSLMLAVGSGTRRTMGSKEGKLLQASSEVSPVPACLPDQGLKSKVVRLHQVVETRMQRLPDHRIQGWRY